MKSLSAVRAQILSVAYITLGVAPGPHLLACIAGVRRVTEVVPMMIGAQDPTVA